MASLFKLATPCIGCVTIGGSLVGSNYLFKKDSLIAIKDSEGSSWNKKLPILLATLEKDEGLAVKIDSSDSKGSKLSITKKESKSIFVSDENAKSALKKWCKVEDKKEEVKYEDSLCKETKKVNWLFN